MDEPSAESAYMFSHALLQRACYELMMPSTRGELHRRALEYLHAHNLATPEELAGHALAGQVGAPRGVSEQLKDLRRGFLRQAALHALESYANERGLALLDALFMCEGVSEAERLEIRRRKAETLNRIGRMDEAVAEAEQALADAQAMNDALEVARAQLTLGRCCLDTSSNARAPQLLAPAVEALRKLGDQRTLELAISAMSRALFTASKPEEALALAREAVQLSEALGEETRAVRGRMQVMTILAQLARDDEALNIFNALAPLLDSSPNAEIRSSLASSFASLSHGRGQLEESGRYHERASSEAKAAGMQAEVARAEVNLGGIDFQLRRFSSGLRHLDAAEAMARELGNLRILWFATRNRFQIYDAIGDFRSALQAATAGARIAKSASMDYHFLLSNADAVSAHLELGQADDALDCVDEALQAPRTGQYLNFVLAKLHAQRACALFRLDRKHPASESVGDMERFLKLAGSEPGMDSQRWIQEARSLPLT